MKLKHSPSPRPCAVRTVHRLELYCPERGMVFDDPEWSQLPAGYSFIDAVAASEALRSGLAEPFWREWFLPRAVRTLRRDLRALDIDPLKCVVRVSQVCGPDDEDGEHGRVVTHAQPVRWTLAAA